MAQRIQYRDPKDSEKAISKFSSKVLRRLHQLGARSHSIDDVKQELWIAWCKACESYDPAAGAQFSTYLHLGMQRHINRYIEKNFERFYDGTIALSLDGTETGEDMGGVGTLADVVADPNARQDTEVEQESCFAYALTRLSPRAKQFITILKEQPKDLIEEVRRLEDKAEYAKERGITFATAHRITTPMVFDFMGASRTERKQIMDEVTQIGELISNQVAA
ncbi:sigma factor [Agrobacterium sp. CG674]